MGTIGLPKIKIAFETKGLTAIQRSERGIVLLFLKSTKKADTAVYTSLADLPETLDAKNRGFISKAFLGSPNKVITMIISNDLTLENALKEAQVVRFNYAAMPEATPEENKTIISWIKEQAKKDKTYKYVCAGQTGVDHICVINLANEKAWEGATEVTGQVLTARLAGIFAGLSLQRSSTYYVLPEITRVEQFNDVEKTINDGNIALIDDGEKIKIARGVNTFTTYTATEGEDLSKIKIVEGMHMIKDDIANTFHDYYVGKVNNTYANKQLFFANINQVYFRQLLGDVFDAEYDNRVDVDMEAQRQYCVTKGEKVENMTEMQIKTYPTGSKVFGAGKVKFVDAMEDLYLKFQM